MPIMPKEYNSANTLYSPSAIPVEGRKITTKSTKLGKNIALSQTAPNGFVLNKTVRNPAEENLTVQGNRKFTDTSGSEVVGGVEMIIKLLSLYYEDKLALNNIFPTAIKSAINRKLLRLQKAVQGYVNINLENEVIRITPNTTEASIPFEAFNNILQELDKLSDPNSRIRVLTASLRKTITEAQRPITQDADKLTPRSENLSQSISMDDEHADNLDLDEQEAARTDADTVRNTDDERPELEPQQKQRPVPAPRKQTQALRSAENTAFEVTLAVADANLSYEADATQTESVPARNRSTLAFDETERKDADHKESANATLDHHSAAEELVETASTAKLESMAPEENNGRPLAEFSSAHSSVPKNNVEENQPLPLKNEASVLPLSETAQPAVPAKIIKEFLEALNEYIKKTPKYHAENLRKRLGSYLHKLAISDTNVTVHPNQTLTLEDINQMIQKLKSTSGHFGSSLRKLLETPEASCTALTKKKKLLAQDDTLKKACEKFSSDLNVLKAAREDNAEGVEAARSQILKEILNNQQSWETLQKRHQKEWNALFEKFSAKKMTKEQLSSEIEKLQKEHAKALQHNSPQHQIFEVFEEEKRAFNDLNDTFKELYQEGESPFLRHNNSDHFLSEKQQEIDKKTQELQRNYQQSMDETIKHLQQLAIDSFGKDKNKIDKISKHAAYLFHGLSILSSAFKSFCEKNFLQSEKGLTFSDRIEPFETQVYEKLLIVHQKKLEEKIRSKKQPSDLYAILDQHTTEIVKELENFFVNTPSGEKAAEEMKQRIQQKLLSNLSARISSEIIQQINKHQKSAHRAESLLKKDADLKQGWEKFEQFKKSIEQGLAKLETPAKEKVEQALLDYTKIVVAHNCEQTKVLLNAKAQEAIKKLPTGLPHQSLAQAKKMFKKLEEVQTLKNSLSVLLNTMKEMKVETQSITTTQEGLDNCFKVLYSDYEQTFNDVSGKNANLQRHSKLKQSIVVLFSSLSAGTAIVGGSFAAVTSLVFLPPIGALVAVGVGTVGAIAGFSYLIHTWRKNREIDGLKAQQTAFQTLKTW